MLGHVFVLTMLGDCGYATEVTHIISFINFKGGVGKTTTLVQVAETLSAINKYRVLVLDLDPQTNATIALIGEERWQQADEDKQTLAHLFLDKLDGTNNFDLEKALIVGVSNLKTRKIDLIPSSIQLVEAQDRMHEVAIKSSFTMSPMEIVKMELSGLFSNYDFILIDCPPNLGFITQNGLEVSHYYVTPVIPDVMSTYGIPQIIQRIEKYARTRKIPVKSLGVVVTKFNSSSTLHKSVVKMLPRQLAGYYTMAGASPALIFKTTIPQANRYSEVMDYTAQQISYKDKWGTGNSGSHALHYYPWALTQEILSRLEGEADE